MRLRSIARVAPGGDLEAALASDADAVLLPLTDETAPIETLRRAAAADVARVAEAGKAAIAAINHPRTQLTRGDLDALVAPALSAVFLPHCIAPQDVRDAAVLLREFEYARDIEPGAIALFPVVDTARGLLCAADALAAAPRAGGAVLASEGYARDVGARLEESGPRLAHARGAVVAAAAAHEGIAIIDGSPFELRDMANYGFAGAVLDDVRLVSVANDVFTPTPAALRRARADLDAYESRTEGAWVARRAGAVVDAHRARAARRMIERASAEDG